MIQKHLASRAHYDFRLEIGGVLESWAVPRGPTLLSGDPRLAVKVEAHPMEYGKFEGVIPKGNYGAGTVQLWDEGTYIERGSSGRLDSEKAMREGLAKGHLTFILDGAKLKGEFALVKIKKKGSDENAWLLVKKHDAYASRRDVLKEDVSVATGRSVDEIREQAPAKGEIWLPGKGRAKPESISVRKVKATRGEMPRKQRPMEPTFASSVPIGEGWLFESFGEGYRALAEVTKEETRLYSKSLLPLEKKYPAIVAALRGLKHEAVLDGEIVKPAAFLISDLLYLDGLDLRSLPLVDRKKQLARLKLKAPLALAETSTKMPPAAQIVAKRADSPYRSGLTRDWVRLRTSAGGGDRAPLTHPEKVFWPKEKITKGDLYRYYDEIADTILPYLVDRPQSLHRQPDGLKNEGFFHKDMTSFLPKRIQTERVYSGSSGRTINYALCQDRWSLLYLINLGCIELNPWLSRRPHLDKPDLIVIDLDPDDNDFEEVIQVAQQVHRVLKAVGADSYPKTSGSSGLHICIPTVGGGDYDQGREFAEAVCRVVNGKLPKLTSVERNPAKRRRRIYLDFLQNRRSQTLAAPYCVRPRPGATVSAPLKWSEVKSGLHPSQFTIQTIGARLERVGDLWKPFQSECVDIAACQRKLAKRFLK